MRRHLTLSVALLAVLLCTAPPSSHGDSDLGHLYREGLVHGFKYAAQGTALGTVAGFIYAQETGTPENNFNLGRAYPALGAVLGSAVGSALGSGLGVHRAGDQEGYRGSLAWTLVGSSLGAALPTVLWMKLTWQDWGQWPPDFGNGDLPEGRRVSRRTIGLGVGAVAVSPGLAALGAVLSYRLSARGRGVEPASSCRWPIIQVSLTF